MPYLSASEVVFHEEALYQAYAALPLPVCMGMLLSEACCSGVDVLWQLSTSVKQMLDHWNMSTMVWLRYVVYERWRSVAGVFFFSALWHGFYAGYYLTFLGAALVLETSRLVSGVECVYLAPYPERSGVRGRYLRMPTAARV